MTRPAIWIPRDDELVAAEINPEERGTWRRFAKLLWQAKLPVVAILILFVLTTYAVNIGLDQTKYTADIIAGDVSVAAVGLLVAAMLVTWALGTITGVLSGLIEQIINRNLRRLLWARIQRLPMRFFDTSGPRELVSRITTDTNLVGQFVMVTIYPLLITAYTSAAIAGRLFEFDYRLSLAVIVFIPVFVLLGYFLGKFDFFANRAVTVRTARLTQRLSEYVTNIPLIKSFAVEPREEQHGRFMIGSLYRARVRTGLVSVLSLATYGVVGLAQTTVIIATGIYLIIQGDLSTSQWVAFFLYSGTLAGVVNGLTGSWQQFKAVQGTTSRIAAVIDVPEEPSGDAPFKRSPSAIEVKDVAFCYEGDDETDEVLENVSVVFPRSQCTVIVGPSGSGKSTLLALLQRLYAPCQGTISMHGRSIADFEPSSFRASVGGVAQDGGIVSGSVRQNLLLGSDMCVDDEHLEAALNLHGADDFVSRLPSGLDTSVGEHGEKLSGGQRNRIAIARSLLRDTPIVIMDEPTAAMDSTATANILEAIKRMTSGKTLVLVAHTPAALAIADHVVIMEEGAVTFSGNPGDATQIDFYKSFTHGGEHNGD